MNFMSLNINGLGKGDRKKIWLKETIEKQQCSFICLQETRVADSRLVDISGMWGSDNYEIEFVNPTGRSGGIISVWDPNIFTKSNVTSSRNYLAITGKWKGVSNQVTIANVYGPQSRSDKKKLWSDLIELKRNTPGIWIVLGDFNAVRYAHERINSSFCQSTAKDFKNFIAKADLQEFNTGGRKFTYM